MSWLWMRRQKIQCAPKEERELTRVEECFAEINRLEEEMRLRMRQGAKKFDRSILMLSDAQNVLLRELRQVHDVTPIVNRSTGWWGTSFF